MTSESEISSPANAGAPFARSFGAGVRGDLRRLMQDKPGRARAVLVALTNRGFHALVLYRLARAARRARVPLVPLLLTRIAQTLFAIDIAPEADLGPGIVIVHGFGIVIGGEARVEGDCCFYHGVTLGNRGSGWTFSPQPDGHPYVEKGVMFGAGAKALGPIRIGKSSVIGANSVVTRDVPPHSLVAGVPGKVVGHVEKTLFSSP